MVLLLVDKLKSLLQNPPRGSVGILQIQPRNAAMDLFKLRTLPDCRLDLNNPRAAARGILQEALKLFGLASLTVLATLK